MSDIVIKAEHLSKMYRLGVINNGTLFRDIQTWIALKRGKEDPHSKIGENKYNNDADHFWALKDLNLEIKQGDRVGIIGKNGAGKSTLLKILSRITAPTEGTIKIKGKIASLLEVGTGFHSELTGRENIYLNGAILGMKKRRITEKMDEIIAFSGIENHIDTPVKRYSSGMYVRLAFAVAAHLDSDILIADEVLAVGDAEFQKKALGKMQDLSTGQGRTVLFVSHNMAAVKNLCNCGVALERGRIKEESQNIDTLISSYLGKNENKLNFWENKGEFNDPNFIPLKMYLMNVSKSIITSIENTDEDIYLYIEYEIKQPEDMTNIGISFQNANEELIFSSWLRDFENRKLQVGKNNFFIKLPITDLNTGDYTIALHAGVHHIKYIICPGQEPKIYFSIINKTKFSFGDLGRHGIMVSKIEWRNSI
ncbi:MAG: ATP-binding cassette domain-containing protein [Spirochaetaceae bacterium]|nr:ATP-binding cassette domain-containing protein [Spirochaetaceae bacterium]